MDLQIKLANDGYAQEYASLEKPSLPEWAVWKDKAYGITAEPIVFAYNKRLMPVEDVPQTHADLARLLKAKPDEYRGKIASYNPERSGVGFLYITQDAQVNRDTLDFVRALGRTNPKFYTSTGAMMERVISGEHLLAYNMIGSYALERQTRDPSLGVILPRDYTLVMSRIALIPTDARHPNASKVFLDYILSARGQTLLAKRHMAPVRADVAPPEGARPTVEAARAIGVGPALLANLEQLTRQRFLKDWRRTLKGE
jgi:iron(III) transport system substrate-binding protein